MQDILNGLNNEQIEAVKETEGYVRVLAGAGSGKTKALAHRYAYLVQQGGISPQNILCLTFTNKAAKEMKRRISQLLSNEVDTTFISTFHGFCVRILREDISRLFYPESFIILDNSDQKKILEQVYEELELKLDTASFEQMIEIIRVYKNDLQYLDYLLNPDKDITAVAPKNQNESIILKYIQKQKKYFALDFADLLNFVFYLFENHKDILDKWQKRLVYVMIDEFQDVTTREYRLIMHYSGFYKNLFVVGDPDQNIYEWRGSTMKLLVEFDQKHPGTKTVFLNRNYRSTPQILNAANDLIANNKIRVKKDLYTQNPDGDLPLHYHGKSETDEVGFITGFIKDYRQNGGELNDIAILYRSSYLSRVIEQGLLKNNFPYAVFGGVGFYERKEIKDLLSYMRLVAYQDDLSFLRICNVPRRKLGQAKLGFIRMLAEQGNTSYYEALKNNLNEDLFKGSGAKEFVSVIETARAQKGIISVSELLQRLLIDTGYEQYVRESGDMDRLDNMAEFMRSIVQAEHEYGEQLPLEVFLQDASLHTENMDDEQKKEQVRLMTLHTAKRLEFPVVILIGLSEGIFPSARSVEQRKADGMEEERRLCFVGMTRARKQLILTDSEGFGVRGTAKIPSRFLFEIRPEHIRRKGVDQRTVTVLSDLYSTDTVSQEERPLLQVGDRVHHTLFKEGVVEIVNTETGLYHIRFANGVRPITFDYTGLKKLSEPDCL